MKNKSADVFIDPEKSGFFIRKLQFNFVALQFINFLDWKMSRQRLQICGD